MTRNHTREPEPYRLAAVGLAHGAVVKQQSPLAWARAIHTQWTAGQLAPKKEPLDAASIRKSIKPELAAQALRTAVRGENALKLRSMIRALRVLDTSADAKDKKAARELSLFLGNVWGVRIAAEVVSEGEVEALDKLTEEWGKAQLPPAGATVNQWVADELLISAAVRRLG